MSQNLPPPAAPSLIWLSATVAVGSAVVETSGAVTSKVNECAERTDATVLAPLRAASLRLVHHENPHAGAAPMRMECPATRFIGPRVTMVATLRVTA